MLRWFSYALPGQTVALADSTACPELRKCALASSLRKRACLSGREHWQYCSRSLALAAVRKPGLVSFIPGATLAVELDSTIPSTHGRALVTLSHLVSYEGMGRARISCVRGHVLFGRTRSAARPVASSGSLS